MGARLLIVEDILTFGGVIIYKMDQWYERFWRTQKTPFILHMSFYWAVGCRGSIHRGASVRGGQI